MSNDDLLWATAGQDAQDEILEQHITAARIAASEHWPFLAAAASQGEYEDRKALVGDRLARVASSLAGKDPVLFGVLHTAIVGGFDEDFAVLDEDRRRKAVLARAKAASRKVADLPEWRARGMQDGTHFTTNIGDFFVDVFPVGDGKWGWDASTGGNVPSPQMFRWDTTYDDVWAAQAAAIEFLSTPGTRNSSRKRAADDGTEPVKNRDIKAGDDVLLDGKWVHTESVETQDDITVINEKTNLDADGISRVKVSSRKIAFAVGDPILVPGNVQGTVLDTEADGDVVVQLPGGQIVWYDPARLQTAAGRVAGKVTREQMRTALAAAKKVAISGSDDLAGKYVVLAAEAMSAQYQDPTWRVFYCEGGFGSQPEAMGTKVFGRYVRDGEQTYCRRPNIDHYASDEEIAAAREAGGIQAYTGARKQAWTEDDSDVTPNASRAMDVADQGYNALHINGIDGAATGRKVLQWNYDHIGDVSGFTEADLDCLTDYNFHTMRAAIEAKQGKYTVDQAADMLWGGSHRASRTAGRRVLAADNPFAKKPGDDAKKDSDSDGDSKGSSDDADKKDDSSSGDKGGNPFAKKDDSGSSDSGDSGDKGGNPFAKKDDASDPDADGDDDSTPGGDTDADAAGAPAAPGAPGAPAAPGQATTTPDAVLDDAKAQALVSSGYQVFTQGGKTLDEALAAGEPIQIQPPAQTPAAPAANPQVPQQTPATTASRRPFGTSRTASYYIEVGGQVREVEAGSLEDAQLAVVKATGVAVADQIPLFGGIPMPARTDTQAWKNLNAGRSIYDNGTTASKTAAAWTQDKDGDWIRNEGDWVLAVGGVQGPGTEFPDLTPVSGWTVDGGVGRSYDGIEGTIDQAKAAAEAKYQQVSGRTAAAWPGRWERTRTGERFVSARTSAVLGSYRAQGRSLVWRTDDASGMVHTADQARAMVEHNVQRAAYTASKRG